MLNEQRAFVEIKPQSTLEIPPPDQALVKTIKSFLEIGGWNEDIIEGFHPKAGSETDFYSFSRDDAHSHLYISSEGKYITFSTTLTGYRFSYFDGNERRIMEADEHSFRFQDDKLTDDKASRETFFGEEALERGFALIEQIGEHLPHRSALL